MWKSLWKEEIDDEHNKNMSLEDGCGSNGSIRNDW